MIRDMDTKPPRFANPGVLSPDREPARLEHFRDSLPSQTTVEIVEQAARILGSEEAATVWLHTPAIGLGLQRPVDLLGSSPELVTHLLTHLNRGFST
jgi:uncharacterized protein (DUF2384 family)